MSANSADYTQRIIGNAEYSSYYAAMNSAVLDGQDVSDSMSDANTNLPDLIREQGAAVRSIRMAAMSGLAGLGVLGAGLDESGQATVVLKDVLGAAMAASAIYSMIKSAAIAKTAIETAIAAAEAVDIGAIPVYGAIALATAAAAFAATYAAFNVSYSQSVTSVADISTPQGRRQAQTVLRGVVANG